MGIVGCWFQRTLKQLEREQTDRQTHTQDDYSNPRASKAKEVPSPRRSAYRRFILGRTCSPLEYRWRFLVTGRVGERDGGDFDAESSMPTEKRSSLHGGGETDKTGDTTGHFSDIQMASADVTVTTVTGNLTS